MSKSIFDIQEDNVKIYGTEDNTYEDFPVGTHVKIICSCQDFHFFFGETGKVIKNGNRYLSIIVEYDKPRHYVGGAIEKTFNFEPRDLVIWDDVTKEISKEQERLKKLGKEEKALEEENKQRSERFELMDL